MPLKKCPTCGRNSVIRVPGARIMRESLGCMLDVANEHSFDCVHPGCNYTTETIRENTEMGNYFKLPFLKRFFTKMPI